MARVFDVAGTLTEFNRANTASQANAVALRMDWAVVGRAMREAMAAYAEETSSPAEGAGAAELAGDATAA